MGKYIKQCDFHLLTTYSKLHGEKEVRTFAPKSNWVLYFASMSLCILSLIVSIYVKM